MIIILIIQTLARPDAYLTQPIPRDNMISLAITPPCGGVSKGKSHFLSQPGSFNSISWKVRIPSPGRCSVHLMFGSEYTESHILIPTDNSTDSSGFFPCGNEEGDFSKVFKFPESLSSESCTLQWTWENKLGTYYHCSDIEVLEDKNAACYGKCQNSGFCSEGLCVCPKGFIGTFCEKDNRIDGSSILILFLSLLVLMCVAGFLIVLLLARLKHSKPTYLEKLCFRKCCFWLPGEWKSWDQELK